MTKNVARNVYADMTTDGSQLTAFVPTAPTSPLKRLSISPFENAPRACQSASMTRSNTSCRTRFVMNTLSFADRRLSRFVSRSPRRAVPVMTAAANTSRSVCRPTTTSTRSFPATDEARPSVLERMPTTVYSATRPRHLAV